MDTYKFERLKKQAKECLPGLFTSKTMMYTGENVAPAHLALVELIESGRIRQTRGRLLGTDLYDVFEQEALPIIDRWDIRDARALAALIPNFVPSWIKQGRFTAEIDDKGEWVLRKAA